jgi:uncharacterized protein involved in exopolysaccharide biosynthesis/septum formation inhibitor-activating ATPase MinD
MSVNHLDPSMSQIASGPIAFWTPDPAPPTGNTGPLDLDKMIRLLRWHARLIAAIVAITVVAAAAALIVLPPKYKAITVVLVDPRQPRVTASEAVLTGIGADAAAVESQVELIQSSALAKRVIAKLKLDQDPEFAAASLLDGVRELFGRSGDDSDVRLNRLIYRFQSGLSVQRRGLTYILEVGYASTSPQKAALISGAVADAYLDDQRMRRSAVTADASGWLGSRIDELRQKLEKSERAVADYKASNNMINVTQGNNLVARQIEDITQQIALARSRKAEAQGRLDRLKDVGRHPETSSGLGEVLQSQVVGTLRTQYAEVARQEADFRAIYGDKHPSLVAIRAQAADIKRQIDSEIARISDGIRNDYQVAKSREAALEAELATLQTRAETMGQADVRLRELEREAQSDRSLYEAFLNRAKETGEQQSLQIAEARIASPALVPIRPERPATPLLLAAAALLGLLAGVGLVLILEQLRRGLRSAEDVEQALGIATLGVLPEQHGAADIQARARYALNNPASDYAGSLWATMTRLNRATRSQRTREVLAIVSAVPGEGKSTFACNLALVSAAAGARTLLIDGDPLAMSVTRAFALNQPGLNEVLNGRAKLANAIAKDPRTGLHVLSARDASSGAHELFGVDSQALAALLRELREQFELIVIDSPAILPVDGGTFVEHADQVAFVIAWDTTERSAVEQAFGLLGAYRAKIVGAVLNKASPRWYRVFDGARHLRYTNAAAATPAPAPAPALTPAPTPVAVAAPKGAASIAAFNRRAAL